MCTASTVKPRPILRILWNTCVHITLFLMLLSWACPYSPSGEKVYFYQISYIIMILLFSYIILRDFRFNIRRLVLHYYNILKQSRSIFVFLFLIIYLLYDFSTLFWAQTPAFVLKKYTVILQMLLWVFSLIYYIFPVNDFGNSRKRLLALLITWGASAVAIALIGLLGYWTDTYTVYVTHISTYADYNQYSTIILMGFIALWYGITSTSIPLLIQRILLGACSAVSLSAILLSGSRRNFILGLIFAVLLPLILLAHDLYQRKKEHWDHHHFRRWALSYASMILVFIFATSGVLIKFNQLIDHRYILTLEAPPQTSSPGDVDFSNDDEPSDSLSSNFAIKQTVDSILSGSAISKRLVIWKIALHEVRTWPIRSWIFGEGASKSWDIYDNMDNKAVVQLVDIYRIPHTVAQWMNPHNFILTDLLNGGLIQVGLLFVLLLAILIQCITTLRKNIMVGLLLLFLYAVLFLTLILSAPFGMTNNKFFWIILGFQLCLNPLVAGAHSIYEASLSHAHFSNS